MTKAVIIFLLFLSFSTKPIEVLGKNYLSELDKEIIQGTITTQKETIEAYNEFLKTLKIKTKLSIFVKKSIRNHKINLEKLKLFKIGEEKQSIIDYEIPIDDLDNDKKFVLFLIDLEETNINSYKEAIIEILDPKLKEIMINIISKDSINLKMLRNFNQGF